MKAIDKQTIQEGLQSAFFMIVDSDTKNGILYQQQCEVLNLLRKAIIVLDNETTEEI